MGKSTGIRRIIAPLFIAALIVFPLVAVAYILFPRPAPSRPLSGFDVLHNCRTSPSVSLYLQPMAGSTNVMATVQIKDWGGEADSCNAIEIHFPGRTDGHEYLVNLNSFDDLMKMIQENPKGYSRNTRRPLAQAQLYRDDLLGEDVIKLDPAKMGDFGGIIEFVWIDGLKKTDFEKYNLFLPFQSTLREGNPLQSTRKFRVQALSLPEYDLTSRVPESSSVKTLGDTFFYTFDIEAGKTPLSLTFENSRLAAYKTYLIMLFSTLFGIGIGLGIEGLLGAIRDRRAEQTMPTHSSKRPSKRKPDKNRKR
jgi:hypothetical protein